MNARRFLFSGLLVCALAAGCRQTESDPMVTMSMAELQDKIKGGWAGQAIGCTYGGPTEFRYCGTMINDNIGIKWPEHYLKYYFENSPGLYDDIYMDLTFVDVFDKEGLDAPIEHFAKAFANAGYPLWHANQQARYNILQGMMPPECGYWENNPHADDIDFQIEADYAGLMAPGMPNAASHYSDAIGHIMNYGDGWYGGVYVAAMYSLAFVYDDINVIVREALKTIPAESRFHKCMSDVIRWHEMYPEDWELTWAMAQKRWSFDIGCPDGVYKDFNIDAVINSAYIIIGLLYGEGDFGKTIEVATRCGQDSDCNPASAGGILGTMLGYSNIPEFWMPNLREVEDLNFAYTDISLNKVYQMSFDQALQVIEKNGGSIAGDNVKIRCQAPEAVRFEESFPGHWPVALNHVDKTIDEVGKLSFEGKGIVVSFWYDTEDYGQVSDKTTGKVAKVEVYLDGELSETVTLPGDFRSRKQEMYYRYKLPAGSHTLSFKRLDPGKDKLTITSYLVYSDRPEN